MKINSLRNRITILFCLFSGVMMSQVIKSDSITVIKQYTPTVHDAFKIREVPKITDSINLEKRPVQYTIFSVPVASTFSPAKGRATTVERERPPKLYDNYVTLGFGTYTSALAEFYSNIEISRTDNFGIFLNHNSAQGGIENVVLDDSYYDTELNLNYSSRNRNLIWNLDVGAEHQLFNWYGIEEEYEDIGMEIDPQHNYLSAYVGGEVNLKDSFFDRAKARYRYFRDDYESNEHRFIFTPTLEIPIGGELFNTDLIVDYVGGTFEEGFYSETPIDYGFLNVGIESGLVILRDDLTLNLGAAIYYSMDSQASDGGIYVYPQVTASYRMAGDYFIAYAGLEGELLQNSYYEFVQRNPFLSPTLEIQPTDQQYDFYVGAKGKLSTVVGYNVRANYISENFKPLIVANPSEFFGNNKSYAFGNSFGIVYDNVDTMSAFGELNFDINRNFSLRFNAEYFLYNTDTQKEAWNLPQYKANVLADYQITENWFAGANVFLVGERKEVDYVALTPEGENLVTELDPYADLNARLGYRFNDRLSIFARGNNLLGENYEKWQNYPVLGLQVLAGATYKFDFGR